MTAVAPAVKYWPPPALELGDETRRRAALVVCDRMATAGAARPMLEALGLIPAKPVPALEQPVVGQLTAAEIAWCRERGYIRGRAG